MSSWTLRAPRKRDLSAFSTVSDPVNEIIYPPVPLPPVVHPSYVTHDMPSNYLAEIANPDSDVCIRAFSLIDAEITFIIPTMNRPTLSRTLASLYQQSNPKWKAIVLFDRCEPTEDITDTRILHLSIHSAPSPGRAGHLRNIGMLMVTTPWIGFVDDDDVLLPHYVRAVLEESSLMPQAALISFRMIEEGRVIPPPFCQTILPNQIGISFAIKSSLVKEGFLFTAAEREDYHYVKAVKQAKKFIILSSAITYLVRNAAYQEHPEIVRMVLR